MFEEMVMVAVMSALLGMIVGLLVRPASEMAKVLGAQGLAMLRGNGKRGQDKPRKKRVTKVKAAKEPTTPRRQPKAKPMELAAPIAVADSAKSKKKVGRPSKAELARRAALEHEHAKSEALKIAPLTTVQSTTEATTTPLELTSGQLKEIAVFAIAESPVSQTDKQANASST